MLAVSVGWQLALNQPKSAGWFMPVGSATAGRSIGRRARPSDRAGWKRYNFSRARPAGRARLKGNPPRPQYGDAVRLDEGGCLGCWGEVGAPAAMEVRLVVVFVCVVCCVLCVVLFYSLLLLRPSPAPWWLGARTHIFILIWQ